MFRRARPLIAYGLGEGVYFIGVQLLVMGALARSLSAESFGAFALMFSVAMLLFSVVSRTLQHFTICQYGSDNGSVLGFWQTYGGMWGGGALLAGGLGFLAIPVLGSAIGVPSPDITWSASGAVGIYAFTQTLFDARTTRSRTDRAFTHAAWMLGAYGILAFLLVTAIAGRWSPLWGLAVTGATVLAASRVWTIVRSQGKRKHASAGMPRSDMSLRTLPAFIAFSVLSLVMRYGDRFVVGGVLGAESAGTFFALNNSALAVLLPLAFVGRYVHGYLAQCSSIESLPPVLVDRVSNLAVPGVLGGIAIGVVGGLAVLRIVYPTVALDGLGWAWVIFAAGRVLSSTRWVTEPFLTRFGLVASLLRLDVAVFCLEAVVVSAGALTFGLSGALVGSGLTFAVMGLAPWWLCRRAFAAERARPRRVESAERPIPRFARLRS